MEKHKNNLILKLYEDVYDSDYRVLNTFLVDYILNNDFQNMLLNWSKNKNIDLRDLRILYINFLIDVNDGRI